MMGLRAKFNLAILAAMMVGFLIAAAVLERVFMASAREQVLQNARLMMAAANAIRTYTVTDLLPLLPTVHEGKFVPETVPAYAAQKNFKAVQATFVGFTYREPTLNPTNLSDRAQDWEADIISYFRNAPSEQELVVERDTPTGRTLNLAHPISVPHQGCLRCHSTPAEAPEALTQTYGTDNGFGWKLNETVGAQVLSVPMAIPLKLALDAYRVILGILVLIFVIIFLVLNLLLHYLVITPVKRVSAAADAISLGDESIEMYIKPGKDEISSLSVSFNRMRESLERAMNMIK
jgi:HAMP domain-containing protein/type II secretory pathway pseudopilin PulG